MNLHERLLFNKKFSGILWTLFFEAVLVGVSLIMLQILRDTPPVLWYVFCIILRIVLGMGSLLVIKKVYGREVKEVLTLKNSKAASVAGIGFILYFAYWIFVMCLAGQSVHNLDAVTLIFGIVLGAFSTGFCEELIFRVLFLEGYFHGERSLKSRLIYTFANFLIFGIPHLMNLAELRTFLHTGIIGFAFSVMYLKSRNILVPIMLHFVYDVAVNLTMFISSNGLPIIIVGVVKSGLEVMYAVMFVLSFVILLKKENEIVEETDVSQMDTNQVV